MEKYKNISATGYLILLSLWLLSSCGSVPEEAKKEVDVVPVKLYSLDSTVQPQAIAASGKFTTDDEVYLSFKSGGLIQKIWVKAGDPVRSGQLLATLHLAEINAQVAQAKAAYDKSVRDQERAGNLLKDSVASLEQFQNATTAMELARQQYNAALFNRNYSEIRAPQNGFVLARLASEGQMVGPGTPVVQTNGASGASWFLKVAVSDKEWAKIKTGDQAEVRNATTGSEAWPATVIRKSEGVDPYNGTFTIDIKLKNFVSGIASGMFGEAWIYSSGVSSTQPAQQWRIPYECLLEGDGHSGFVFVTDDNKTVRKIKVRIAGMDTEGIWINKGLESVNNLIISGSAYLNENSRIRIEQ